jgi:hypothetical protein
MKSGDFDKIKITKREIRKINKAINSVEVKMSRIDGKYATSQSSSFCILSYYSNILVASKKDRRYSKKYRMKYESASSYPYGI